MIHIVYFQNGKLKGYSMPIIVNTCTTEDRNTMFRNLINGGLDNEDNIVKRGEKFTAIIFNGDGQPIYAYSTNADNEMYEMKAEYDVVQNFNGKLMREHFGRYRPENEVKKEQPRLTITEKR